MEPEQENNSSATHPNRLFLGHVPPEARTSAFDALFFNLRSKWQFPFWLMLALSVGIASPGLSENSAATVIGAMIVALLGQPIIALGASVAIGWAAQGLRLFALTAVGALTAVALAYLIGAMFMDATPSDQVLARTAPDLRDLGIAVCAGAAGAYGYHRGEFSTVLAGVAIAVALVPPLCTAGLMLEEGRFILASGGLLLFAMNLVGITFASTLVFFIVGIKGATARRGWFVGGSVATIVAGAAILTPLAINYDKFARSAQLQEEVYATVANVLHATRGAPQVTNVSVNGAEAAITLTPLPTDFAQQQRLTDALQQATGLQVSLVGASPQS